MNMNFKMRSFYMKLARIQVKNDIQEGFIHNKWRKISSCWGTKVKMKEESSFSAGCWGKGLPKERSFHACSLDLIFPGLWFEAVSVQNYGGTGAVHFLYFSLLESVWEGRWVLEAEKTSTDCSRVVHRLGLVTCAHLLTSPSLSFFICTRGA